MEWPKRVRTADWENGVLILDGEKKFDIPELTTEIMERLAGYALVGFQLSGFFRNAKTSLLTFGRKCWYQRQRFVCFAK